MLFAKTEIPFPSSETETGRFNIKTADRAVRCFYEKYVLKIFSSEFDTLTVSLM